MQNLYLLPTQMVNLVGDVTLTLTSDGPGSSQNIGGVVTGNGNGCPPKNLMMNLMGDVNVNATAKNGAQQHAEAFVTGSDNCATTQSARLILLI